tara:strand:+ start:3218 stop:3643 length:426 start_codon:yes stop_codon:yes gene_type:complete
MTKEIIGIGDDVHEIEVRPLTLLFKSPNLTQDVEYAERIPLDYEVCTYHMDRVQKFHALTPILVKMVFVDYDKEITPGNCRDEGRGFQHIAGLMDMTLKFMDKGVPIAWVHPESHIHPKHQCQLGDVAVCLAKGEIPDGPL